MGSLHFHASKSNVVGALRAACAHVAWLLLPASRHTAAAGARVSDACVSAALHSMSRSALPHSSLRRATLIAPLQHALPHSSMLCRTPACFAALQHATCHPDCPTPACFAALQHALPHSSMQRATLIAPPPQSKPGRFACLVSGCRDRAEERRRGINPDYSSANQLASVRARVFSLGVLPPR